MREPELLTEYEGLADAGHGDAEDHVVADLGSLAGPGRTAMDDPPSHSFKHRSTPAQGTRRPSDHEGQRAGTCPGRSPRHRRIQ